jgi:hypothetical protein
MIAYLKLIWNVFKHKYFVFRAGMWTKTPIWQLIIHDFSKLGPREFKGYVDKVKGQDTYDFENAWLHHITRNPHHWEHWCLDNKPIGDIPEKYVREMVADWFGAARSYNGAWPEDERSWKWLNENYHRIKLTDATHRLLEKILDEAFKNKNRA